MSTMDEPSSMEIAFDDWVNSPDFCDDIFFAWQAACAWQREKDAEICESMVKEELEAGESCWQHMECASAIRNQGDE